VKSGGANDTKDFIFEKKMRPKSPYYEGKNNSEVAIIRQ